MKGPIRVGTPGAMKFAVGETRAKILKEKRKAKAKVAKPLPPGKYQVSLRMEGQDPKSWTIDTTAISKKDRAIAYIKASQKWKELHGATKQSENDLARVMGLPENTTSALTVHNMRRSVEILDEVLEVLESAP